MIAAAIVLVIVWAVTGAAALVLSVPAPPEAARPSSLEAQRARRRQIAPWPSVADNRRPRPVWPSSPPAGVPAIPVLAGARP